MSKILSQDEVNALLDDIKVTKEPINTEKKSVNLYDFKHPDRISKDQLRALKTIHTNFAKAFGTYLSTKLRTTVDINVLSVDQLTYTEFTTMMASPTCIYIVELEQDNGSIIIEFATELVFYAIDRLLGGLGEAMDEIREITIIEESVLKKIVQKAIIQLDEAWQQVATLGFRLTSFETNPQFVQIAPASEPSIVISFSVKINNFNSIITLCFPYFVLEPIIQKLNIQDWISSKQKGKILGNSSLIENQLKSTPIELVARMDSTPVKFSDIMNLEIGDVLLFDRKTNMKFEILLAGKPKFLTRPGIAGDFRACKIIDYIYESTEKAIS